MALPALQSGALSSLCKKRARFTRKSLKKMEITSIGLAAAGAGADLQAAGDVGTGWPAGTTCPARLRESLKRQGSIAGCYASRATVLPAFPQNAGEWPCLGRSSCQAGPLHARENGPRSPKIRPLPPTVQAIDEESGVELQARPSRHKRAGTGGRPAQRQSAPVSRVRAPYVRVRRERCSIAAGQWRVRRRLGKGSSPPVTDGVCLR